MAKQHATLMNDFYGLNKDHIPEDDDEVFVVDHSWKCPKAIQTRDASLQRRDLCL